MLLQHIQAGAVPVINMGHNQPVIIDCKFAPTGDGNTRLPGQWGIPTKCPVGADLVRCLLDVVYFHVAVTKPGLDEADHLPIAIASPKFRHRIFKVHILGVDFVGLILREAIVVGLENGQQIHERGWGMGVGGWGMGVGG